MNRIRTAWRIFNLPCEAITALVSQSLDRELPPLECWAVRTHLLYCVACRRFRRQALVLRRALGRASERLDEMVPGACLPPEVRERLRRTLGGG
jgi:predicted anti-sigma-YlaC factor YlaD